MKRPQESVTGSGLGESMGIKKNCCTITALRLQLRLCAGQQGSHFWLCFPAHEAELSTEPELLTCVAAGQLSCYSTGISCSRNFWFESTNWELGCNSYKWAVLRVGGKAKTTEYIIFIFFLNTNLDIE